MNYLKSYNMVEASSGYDLVTAVNIAIQNGWELHGPTQVVVCRDSIMFFQTMVKIRKEKTGE